MLNRTNSVAAALDARRAIASELRDYLDEVPPSPFDWSSFDPAPALGSGAADLRLVALSRLLCSAPARAAELRTLWTESLVTAAFALRLAPRLGADASTGAIAGLLHRLGDMLTLRAIGAIEQVSGVRLDGFDRSELCASFGGEQLDRALRAWNVPARAAMTAAGWRRLCEFPGASGESATVYLARLFAVERLSPAFCVPGFVEGAIAELGLDAASLSGLRSDATITALLTNPQ